MDEFDVTITGFSLEGRSLSDQDVSHLTLEGHAKHDGVESDVIITLYSESSLDKPEAGSMAGRMENGHNLLLVTKKITRGYFNQLTSEMTTAKLGSCTIRHDGGPIIWPSLAETSPPEATRQVEEIAIRTGPRLLASGQQPEFKTKEVYPFSFLRG